MSALDLDSPQLGEHAWHAFTADASIRDVSLDHRNRIVAHVTQHLPDLDWREARILEVGAYRHYTAHLLAAERGCEAVVTDIAATSLRDGTALANAAGLQGKVTMAVADFHDLPFADNYFDVVFVASAVHHTRRPELVLEEMLRTLKPGGILIIDNEPCARVCCFHAFVSNRQESFTPFEAALHAEGLLPTVSSPYWGARGEALFGMVENDRIPLPLYLETFGRHGSVVEQRLDSRPLVGRLEKQLLALSGEPEAIHAQVLALLRSAVARAQALHGETERLLGYRIPTECEIHEVALRVAAMLQCRPRSGRDDAWRAELFGAAAMFVVRKNGRHAARTALLFRRPVDYAADGLVTERTGGDSVAGRLGALLLPDINTTEDARELEPWFVPTDWHREREGNGSYSLMNLGARCNVRIPPSAGRRVLLIRYYAVVSAGPYHVRVWSGGRLLDDQLTVLQESRLVRAWVPSNAAEILVETCDLDGNPITLPWHVRVGVFQLFATGR